MFDLEFFRRLYPPHTYGISPTILIKELFELFLDPWNFFAESFLEKAF